jgi:hypothetical protein
LHEGVKEAIDIIVVTALRAEREVGIRGVEDGSGVGGASDVVNVGGAGSVNSTGRR